MFLHDRRRYLFMQQQQSERHSLTEKIYCLQCLLFANSVPLSQNILTLFPEIFHETGHEKCFLLKNDQNREINAKELFI